MKQLQHSTIQQSFISMRHWRRFRKERTTIIIAHRTTTIKQADYIYLIEEGRVKAEGSYRGCRKGLDKRGF